jgi:type IV pilus assembly protein PilN
MIRINLLPVREWRRKEVVRQQVSIFLLSLVLLISVLLGVGITIHGKVQDQRQEIKALETRKAELAYVDKTIAEVDNKSKKIEEKFKAIEELQMGRTLAVMVLDEIVSSLPIDRVWITKLVFKNNNLQLSGVALDNHTVALFMKRLQASSLFVTVDLTTTRRNSVQGHDLTEFDLQVGINPSREEKGSKTALRAQREGRRA